MLQTPQPTSYDINFRIFGFPVRIHPLFWVVLLVLGPTNLEAPRIGELITAWMAAGFLSLMVHELGHAFAFRFFGSRGTSIWLYWFGGLAGGMRPAGHWPNIIISLAGPIPQLLLAAAAYAGWQALPTEAPFIAAAFLAFLFRVSLFWAILNLLPIWPLDGGQVAREACSLARVRGPDQAALRISMITALAVAGLGLAAMSSSDFLNSLPVWMPVPSLFGVLLFAALAYSAYENLQRMKSFSGY